MKMIKSQAGLAVLLVVGMMASQAFAQRADRTTTRPGAGQGQGLTMRLQAVKEAVDSLKLTDDQKTKFEAIFSKAKDDMQAKMKDLADMAPQERFQQMRTMFEDLKDKIDGILTDDQKDAFAKKVEEIQQRFRGGQGGQSAAGGRAGQFGDRFREAVQKLDLTDDQKGKVKDVLDAAQKKFQDLRKSAGGDMQQMRDKLPDIMDEMRTDLQQILTPEQQEKLRDLMSASGGDGPGTGQRPGQRRVKSTTTQSSAMMMDENDNGTSRHTKNAAAPAVGGGGVEVGQEAPSFELKKLDGRPVQLSSFKGHVLVLVFGSYSCPTFRLQAAALDQLAKTHANRAEVFVVYTKEAHPKGEHEIARNRDDGIEVSTPASDDDRRALAKKAKESLHLTMPIALDTLDNAIGKAYGAIPNGAVVIGKDGHVFGRQNWAETVSLASLIDQATVVRGSDPDELK